MTTPTLTEQLYSFAVHFRGVQDCGVLYNPETCAAFAATFAGFAQRAAELEHVEASLPGTDVVPHLRTLRSVVVSDPGSNVVAWPLNPRPVPSTGGDMA